MKLLLCLAALVAVASCLPRNTRGVNQFNDMINCATDQWFVSALWSYNGYGCYCGLGGEGVAVDGTDKCCEVHDKCYREANDNGCWGIDRYTVQYKFKADRKFLGNRDTCEIECTAKEDYHFWEFNEDCKSYMCECDRVGALCFRDNIGTYNKKYEGWSQDNCK